MAFKRVVLSIKQIPGGVRSWRTLSIRLAKASFFASTHIVDAIASSIWILEMENVAIIAIGLF